MGRHVAIEECRRQKGPRISFACSDDHMDASPRVVAYRALDQNVVAMSPTRPYRTLEAEGLMADDRRQHVDGRDPWIRRPAIGRVLRRDVIARRVLVTAGSR